MNIVLIEQLRECQAALRAYDERLAPVPAASPEVPPSPRETTRAVLFRWRAVAATPLNATLASPVTARRPERPPMLTARQIERARLLLAHTATPPVTKGELTNA